jgi:hypothetical protein
LGGTEASFTGDEFVAFVFWSDEEWLEYPIAFYGLDQLLMFVRVKVTARLVRVECKVFDRNGNRRWGARIRCVRFRLLYVMGRGDGFRVIGLESILSASARRFGAR